MDLHLIPSSLYLFLLPLFLFLVLKIKNKGSKLPPGPGKLPVIGSIHHLAGGSLPHHTLRDLAKKHGPLMHLQMGEVPVVVASTAEAAKEVMKTQDLNFGTRPESLSGKYITYGYDDVTFAPYGDHWRQMRKICVVELLTARRVESFGYIREEELLNMLRSIAASCDSPVNLTKKFYFLTNNVVGRAAFGVRNKSHDMFLAKLKDVIKVTSGFGVADLFPSSKLILWITGIKAKLQKNQDELDHILSSILEECRVRNEVKKRENGDKGQFDENFVDILLRLQQQGDLQVPITDNKIKAVILNMFTAGTETSANVLVWTMAELMRNPRVMTKAQKEVREVLGGKEKITEEDVQHLQYLKVILKESMRLHPPLPLLMPRESREKCQVMGYELPAQTKVIVNIWAIARDPLIWGDDAETFRPERFLENPMEYKGTNFEYLPFGAGRRMCPGITFGMAAVELPLALLLYHFNWEATHGMGPESIDMTEDFGSTVSLKSELCLVPKLCNPLPKF